MAFLAETFLLKQLKIVQPLQSIQNAAAFIFKLHSQVDLSALVSRSNMSLRQFERIFNEEVGVPPKLFSRIVRFTHALDLKYYEQQRSWADIAISVGDYDQMHFIHECKTFTDEAPSEILKPWSPCQKGKSIGNGNVASMFR
jgi:transcriptional regulator GlxA family with amidase domain